jgi:hypothetical protein
MLFNAHWIGTNRLVSDINIRPRQGVISAALGTQEGDSWHLPMNFRHIYHSPRTLFVLNRIISITFTLAAKKIYRYFSIAIIEQYL